MDHDSFPFVGARCIYLCMEALFVSGSVFLDYLLNPYA